MSDLRIPPLSPPLPPAAQSTEQSAPSTAAVTDTVEITPGRGARLAGVTRVDELDAVFRRTEGWTGADGTYSTPLADGRVLFLFSDTLIGRVDASGRRTLDPNVPENAMGEHFVNNSAALMDPANPAETLFVVGERDGVTANLFDPPDGRGWLWISDVVPQSDGSLTILLNQYVKDERPEYLFGRQVTTWAARTRVVGNELVVDDYTELPHLRGNDPREHIPGAAVLCEGPWAYIYNARAVAGADGEKHLAIARAPLASVDDATAWQFFTGAGWSERPDDARVFELSISNELSVSVTRRKDGYIMASSAPLGDVQIRFAPSPVGPWSDPVTVWVPPETTETVITYNSKAHPHLSDARGLVISYNVNSLDMDESLGDVDVYRPRFVRVPWEQIEAARDQTRHEPSRREADLRTGK